MEDLTASKSDLDKLGELVRFPRSKRMRASISIAIPVLPLSSVASANNATTNMVMQLSILVRVATQHVNFQYT